MQHKQVPLAISFICPYQQVLNLVTPKPTEVIRTSAFRFPDVNRSTDFLPRETKKLIMIKLEL